MAERPSRSIKLATKLLDVDNIATPSIKSHIHNTGTSLTVIEILDDSDDTPTDTSAGDCTERASSKRPRSPCSQNTSEITLDDTEPDEEIKPRENKTKDVDYFFSKGKQVGDSRRRQCLTCSKKGRDKWLVPEATTLRRHMEANHKGLYRSWATKNNFQSMLPSDRKAQKEQNNKASQGTLDGHICEDLPQKRIVKYSDALFKSAAVEWLAVTNQPLSALNHPNFVKMIDIASRAEGGVVIPSNKEIRHSLLDLFKTNILHLRRRLKNDGIGEVSMTCDAWQASNADAYFAVTGHWIEEPAPGIWKLQSALFGFVQMNTSHDGVRLGRALFRVIQRLEIYSKVGWITCDNASNNSTMLRNFEIHLNSDPNRNIGKWSATRRYIRCLAHVINLATQAVLSVYSNSSHFDPSKPNAHEPDVTASSRDEVGLIRAITVKSRSSAKRKELFRQLQTDKPLNLILDMRVRWSSTYNMLKRSISLDTHVTEFMYRIAREEIGEKRDKLQKLILTSEEWGHARGFRKLLSFADDAQQAFSYDNQPALHYGLPALEGLHAAWQSRLQNDRYERYHAALRAGVEKIENYYDKTSTSDAYTFAMILDPEAKMSHFVKYWDEDLAQKIRDNAEEIFKERYIKLIGHGPQVSTTTVPEAASKSDSRPRKIRRLLAHLDSDSDDDLPTAASTPTQEGSSEKPWLREFNRYLDSDDELGENMTIVQWWGIHSRRYPVWASLARDYLAIMASSVSSERAFSSAGITISKRRNRLKGDIVEALQFIKCASSHDLLFREEVLSLSEEEMLQVDDGDPDWEDIREEGWDEKFKIDCDDDGLDDLE